MNIIWVTNIELPDIAELFGRKIVVGGWLVQMSKQLAASSDVVLHILSPKAKESYKDKIVDNVHYSTFEEKYAQVDIENLFNCYKPDIVHIWGTEYFHSLAAINASEKLGILDRTVVSIQGLVSIYNKHYFEGLDSSVVNGKTLKEYLLVPNIYKSMLQMKECGDIETVILKKTIHCIGRTDWDYACVKLINPDINYYHCNESLREAFYKDEWYYEKCDKNSIFFSQANYPIKGFHMMLEALSIIRDFYPEVKLRVLGRDPLESDSFIDNLKHTSYEKYIKELIIKYGLKSNIKWLGTLTADEMVFEYKRANVFVCSSSIENSSNSIGEAMLLGVPIVASDVGGIKSLMVHEKEGILYQFSATYMLAFNVMKLFSDADYAKSLGKNARARAQRTHDISNNIDTLKSVYARLLVGNN